MVLLLLVRHKVRNGSFLKPHYYARRGYLWLFMATGLGIGADCHHRIADVCLRSVFDSLGKKVNWLDAYSSRTKSCWAIRLIAADC